MPFMKAGIIRGVFLLLSGLLLLLPGRLRAETWIYWSFSGFDPSTVVVSPGETVVWANVDPFGLDIVLSVEGFTPFFLENMTAVGTPFNDVGTYNFSSDLGDYGSVIVNIPPSVAITNPPDNAVFPAPASFTIEAAASETPDDSVQSVEFFLISADATNSIGTDFDAPYSASVTDLGAGTYTVVALATDSRGWWDTNSINFTIGSELVLSAPRISAGKFLFDVAGLTVGKTNIVQSSSNLLSWTPVSTNVAGTSSATFTNALVSGPRAYRLAQLP